MQDFFKLDRKVLRNQNSGVIEPTKDNQDIQKWERWHIIAVLTGELVEQKGRMLNQELERW